MWSDAATELLSQIAGWSGPIGYWSTHIASDTFAGGFLICQQTLLRTLQCHLLQLCFSTMSLLQPWSEHLLTILYYGPTQFHLWFFHILCTFWTAAVVIWFSFRRCTFVDCQQTYYDSYLKISYQYVFTLLIGFAQKRFASSILPSF